MQFLIDYGLFLAKTVTYLAAFAAIVGIVSSFSSRRQTTITERVDVLRVNDRYKKMGDAIEVAMLDKRGRKKKKKAARKTQKEDKKKSKNNNTNERKRIFVLDFRGDIRGSEVTLLREEITAILMASGKFDEVLLRLESGGGLVHAYGLAASQLSRLRDQKLHLTVAVDKIAASGGYLMACVADRILAAPFAIIGSIGVVTQIPNFHRLLKKHDIDFEQATAGEYKRTVTMFGETTDKDRKKLKADVEEIHELFKDFVKEQRPIVELDQIATGEHWLAKRAQQLKLVEELKTSDDYLLSLTKTHDIYEVRYIVKPKLLDRVTSIFSSVVRHRNQLNPYVEGETPIPSLRANLNRP